MPSWVVPTVAAEYWGVSVEQVMSDVAAGRVISRSEGGFLFVDVDPSREVPEVAIPKPAYRRPLAWTPSVAAAMPEPVISAAERDALLGHEDHETQHAFGGSDAVAPLTLSEDDIPNWNEVRARVGRTRRAPVCNAA